MPMWRMRRMIPSRSGCKRGSPPLIVITDVPSSDSLSIRRNISSVGTGLETSSYSLQYLHARLQRRIGMMWASKGWSVETIARTTSLAPLRLRRASLILRPRLTWRAGMVLVSFIPAQTKTVIATQSFFGDIRGLNGAKRRSGQIRPLGGLSVGKTLAARARKSTWPCPRVHSSDDERFPGYILNVSTGCSKFTFSACLMGNFLMSGGPKYVRSSVPESGFDQQVVGIERRNRKNSDSVFGKRMQK